MILEIVCADKITIKANFIWYVQIASLTILLDNFAREMRKTKIVNVVILPTSL